MSVRHLGHLLTPASVAVVGASARPGSVGATVWHNLVAGGFEGRLFAVNRHGGTLGEHAVFVHCRDLPEPPDLAVVCTPPATVPQLVAELGAAGTRAVVVMTAGLTAAQKQACLDAARPYVLRILGPNCLGLLSPHQHLNASFAHTDALPGPIAFVSQSGALVTAVLDWAKSRRIGFSTLISLGEHADVDFGDLLDQLASDGRTRAILLYVESIESPRKFMSAARAAARNKPVIVVKAGRAGNGVQAAASHTGALAGSDTVYDAAFRRAGMLRVDTLHDLFMAAETLARFQGAPGGQDGLLLMTNGGGAGVMAADEAAHAGVTLPALSPELTTALDAVLPFNWSRANPLDIIGDAPVERYTATLQALLERTSHPVLFMHAPTAIVHSADIARACLPLAKAHARRLMCCWLGEDSVREARTLFDAAGVADYATPEDAVRAFAMLQTYRRNQATLLEAPDNTGNAAPDLAAAKALIARVLAGGRTMLNEAESKQLLAAYGIPVVETVAVAPTADAAATQAARLGYPVALKILSPDISHKSDVGGVALQLVDEMNLRSAAQTMLARVREQHPQARIEGFTVEPMVQRPHAVELIAGVTVDATFGPVVLFGQGGTAVEVLADRAVALPPLNTSLARELVSRTRVSRLLAGYRDRPAADADALHDVLLALAQMAADLPQLAELDINPLWADERGVLALDARVRLSPEGRAGAAAFAIQPYPAELVEQVQWQGRTVTLRPVRPEDEPQHRELLDRLDATDMRLRFFSSRKTLPRTEVARLVQIDYAREMAFIASALKPDGQPETLGVVRALIDPDDIEAEYAIVVRSDLKGLGLGGLLTRKIIDYLRRRGTQHVACWTLQENEAMRKLALQHGFKRDMAGSDGGTIRFVMPLASPSQA